MKIDLCVTRIANFRDASLASKHIRAGRLYRSGTWKNAPPQLVEEWKGVFGTINLTPEEEDSTAFRMYKQVPAPNSLQVYDLNNPQMASWLLDCLHTIASMPCPVLVHCFSGKDRTGIVIAAIQTICGETDETMLEEYGLSDGLLQAPETFATSLQSVQTFVANMEEPLRQQILAQFTMGPDQPIRPLPTVPRSRIFRFGSGVIITTNALGMVEQVHVPLQLYRSTEHSAHPPPKGTRWLVPPRAGGPTTSLNVLAGADDTFGLRNRTFFARASKLALQVPGAFATGQLFYQASEDPAHAVVVIYWKVVGPQEKSLLLEDSFAIKTPSR